MANTTILVDSWDNPLKRLSVTLNWKGGGYEHIWVDETGRSQFSEAGTIFSTHVVGKKFEVYREVKGDTTFFVKSDKVHQSVVPHLLSNQTGS